MQIPGNSLQPPQLINNTQKTSYKIARFVSFYVKKEDCFYNVFTMSTSAVQQSDSVTF